MKEQTDGQKSKSTKFDVALWDPYLEKILGPEGKQTPIEKLSEGLYDSDYLDLNLGL